MDALKRSGLADFGDAESASPCRPQILFVLSPDEALEVEAEGDIARRHQVDRGKWDGNRCSPTCRRLASGRSPHPIPSGIEVATRALLFHDQAVALCAQRVYLKDIGVAAVVCGI